MYEGVKFTEGLEKLVDTYGKRLDKPEEELFKWELIKQLRYKESLPIKKNIKPFSTMFLEQ